MILFPFVLLFLDGIYLLLMKKYNRNLNVKNYFAMIICYLFVLFSYYYFIYLPNKSPGYAFILGFVINGIYETTNWTLLKNWPLSLVIIDTLWGGILFYLVTFTTRRLRF